MTDQTRSASTGKSLADEIAALKRMRKAVILAHNYCRDDVQDIADFTGDSLELARLATQVASPVIVFCGVFFMAETAAILNPDKVVLIPDVLASCAMAQMVTAAEVRALKAQHPRAVAVCYVNSTAEVKAECDLCVTSGNAEKVMATIPRDREILFLPDQHLGGHVALLEGRKYILWPGFCPVHAKLTAADVARARQAHPNAPVLVHPECNQAVREAADACLSTGGMCRFVKTCAAREVIVGTETGILHRLRKENPATAFHPVREDACCADMKMATLEKIASSLRDLAPRVTVPADIAARARVAIERMLAIV